MKSYWYVGFSYTVDGNLLNGSICVEIDGDFFRPELAIAEAELSIEKEEEPGVTEVENIVIMFYQKIPKEEWNNWQQFFLSREDVKE